MSDLQRRQFNRWATLWPLAALAPSVDAQTPWPSKPIRIVLQFPPGGSTDAVARIFAQYLSRHIPGNPSVVVQNLPGGGGLKAPTNRPLETSGTPISVSRPA